ncbi:uncharacterized protein LOC131165404 [Malania oleifera]|uniref:uncharacterized protein LOC131165404 n=1 Tax=Malania oleifera TaxID=397392 RepID=UPI0025ADC15A|nr:uncharacterized protein LOC131165404 [Malania oleifera]
MDLPSWQDSQTTSFCTEPTSGNLELHKNINVENDEIIAHALQEIFSHLASVEASGSLCAENEQMQASVLAQGWISPSRRHSGTVAGPQNGEEEVDGMGISCSCSGLGEKLVDNDD